VAAGNDASLEEFRKLPAGFPGSDGGGGTTAKTGYSNNKRYAAIQADTASSFTTDGKFRPAYGHRRGDIGAR
jgi:hypothetical protein